MTPIDMVFIAEKLLAVGLPTDWLAGWLRGVEPRASVCAVRVATSLLVRSIALAKPRTQLSASQPSSWTRTKAKPLARLCLTSRPALVGQRDYSPAATLTEAGRSIDNTNGCGLGLNALEGHRLVGWSAGARHIVGL